MRKIGRQLPTTLGVGGLLLAIAPALFYATTVNLVPMAYKFGASAVLVLALRFITNIVVASTMSRGRSTSYSAAPAHERRALVLMSFALVGQTYGMMAALEALPVSIAITTFFTFPVVSYFIERLQRRSRPHLVAILALLTSLCGVWLMTKSSHISWDITGIWWALLSSVLQATIQSAAERVRSVQGWNMVKVTSFVPAIIFVGLALGEARSLSLEAFGWALVVAIGFCLSIYYLYRSVHVYGAVRAANLLYLEPVIAVPISMTVHGDNLSLEQWGGIVLIAIGCGFVEWRERRNSRKRIL